MSRSAKAEEEMFQAEFEVILDHAVKFMDMGRLENLPQRSNYGDTKSRK